MMARAEDVPCPDRRRAWPRPGVALALPLVVAVSACSGPSRPTAPRTAKEPAAAPPPSGTGAPPGAPGPGRDELRAAVCQDRSPCEVQRERPAGADAAGRELSVVRVYAGWEDLGYSDVDGGAPAPPALELEEDDREDTTARAFMGCHRLEYWLVARDRGAIAAATPLVRACNDGYGASGVGEDWIAIGDGTLSHSRIGGSAWRWDFTTLLSLSPLRVLREESSGYWTLGSNFESSWWSWDDFAGETTWYSPPCRADGTPDEPSDGVAIGPGDRGGAERVFAAIPAVALDPAFVAGGWKTASPGRCALRVDASGESGFVTFGGPGDAGDAALAVVASPEGTLFIEVRDDRLVGPSARWIADDHVEVWLSAQQPGYMDHCLAGGDKPLQWGIRLADGKVFAAAGKPDPEALKVERSDGGSGVTRLKVALPAGYEGVTVVYSDSDDGKKQERLIATSKLVYGDATTLGRLRRLPPEAVTCALAGRELTPRQGAFEAR